MASSSANMTELMKTRLAELSEKMRTSSVEVGRKMSEQMTSVSGKVREYFVTQTEADRLIEQATLESLISPDWGKNLEICDKINTHAIPAVDAVRGIKKRLTLKNSHIQSLALVLLETSVKNCELMFSEIATEKILDDMVRVSEDSTTSFSVREKILKLIESWGEATEELRFLPIFEETYKSLKSRGVRFPGRDVESLAPIFTPPQSAPITTRTNDLTPTLVHSPSDKKKLFDIGRNCVELLSTVLTSAPPEEAIQDEVSLSLISQCQEVKHDLELIIQNSVDDETLLFEALSIHDDVDKVLAKYATMKESVSKSETATIESNVDTNNNARLIPNIEEEDSAPNEDSGKLSKNRVVKVHTSEQAEDKAMADLDEMIFGKKGDGSKKSQKEEKDLIVF